VVEEEPEEVGQYVYAFLVIRREQKGMRDAR
jgi:hypothetical protein